MPLTRTGFPPRRGAWRVLASGLAAAVLVGGLFIGSPVQAGQIHPALQNELSHLALTDQASAIVVISLSGGLSATIQSAELASRAVADEIPIAVIDSQSCTVFSVEPRSTAISAGVRPSAASARARACLSR